MKIVSRASNECFLEVVIHLDKAQSSRGHFRERFVVNANDQRRWKCFQRAAPLAVDRCKTSSAD